MSSEPVEEGVIAPESKEGGPNVLGGTLPTFLVLLTFAIGLSVLSLLTVHRRSGEEISRNPGARRSHFIIMRWIERGYLSHGGMAWTGPPLTAPPGYFYRSSSSAYRLSGFLVERFYYALRGRYSWRLLAIHNQLLIALSSAVFGFLAFRVLKGAELQPVVALVLAASAQLVFFTFPDLMALYWEMSGQLVSLLFFLLFLLLDHSERDVASPSRRQLVAQMVCAFAVVYTSYVGVFYLGAFALGSLLLRFRPFDWSRAMLQLVVPAAAAFLLFVTQVAWVQLHFPDDRLVGAPFMARSGLDGSTQYYKGHEDLIYGRDVARRNFPANREQLFRWKWLFISGCAAVLVILGLALRKPWTRPMALILLALIGAYLFNAALFSQAVVIHPYLFDLMIACPLILAVFAFLPGTLERLTHGTRIFALVAVFAALWYSMVQIRGYAMRYPMPEPRPTASVGQPVNVISSVNRVFGMAQQIRARFVHKPVLPRRFRRAEAADQSRTGGDREESRQDHCESTAPKDASASTIPFPWTMCQVRSAESPAKLSLSPFGQITVTSASVSGPRPRCCSFGWTER